MINYTEPKLKDFKCFRLPIDNLPKCKELLILGNTYNFFGTYKDGDLSDFTQTPWSGEGAASNFMSFGQFVMNGGHATIIASKETCNYYRKLYKEFYKAGFGTTHPKVTLFEIDDTKFLKGNFKIKDDKEEKLVKGEYFWSQGKDGKWEFNYPDFLKSFFENGEKMFDIVIANPPYGASTHAKIAKALMDIKSSKEYIFLCPTSLLTGYSANCVSVRENYKLDKFEHIGIVDFGEAKPDVSIYYFGVGEEKKDWENLRLEMKPAIEKGIAEKCAKVECLHYDWFKENLSSRAAQDLKKKAKDLTKEEIRQWQIGKMQKGESFICNSVYSNSNADGIVLKNQMSYASSWYGPKELIPKLKNELYKGLAVMFSTNKRDQHAMTLSHLPVDLEGCGFTEEEKNYLLSLC